MSLSAQSWQYRDKRKPKAGTMPISYFECLSDLRQHCTLQAFEEFGALY